MEEDRKIIKLVQYKEPPSYQEVQELLSFCGEMCGDEGNRPNKCIVILEYEGSDGSAEVSYITTPMVISDTVFLLEKTKTMILHDT